MMVVHKQGQRHVIPANNHTEAITFTKICVAREKFTLTAGIAPVQYNVLGFG